MNILVTGANGQLGNEMRIVSKASADKYIFTDVCEQEGNETTFLDITDLQAVRQIVEENNVNAIVNKETVNIINHFWIYRLCSAKWHKQCKLCIRSQTPKVIIKPWYIYAGCVACKCKIG